ncbi:GDSL-type esterase/lipase family protein [Clostridium vincentii]|uniref:Arylesterase n=1 Tax=Clostridium vincentii TaxID=52704 RepID=A0A2T0BH73_9CLOT|nr:GDSL-type esterase/lipase family protein [Clostridium vincentii]PRR83198.1 Arylesterase precursor [Clostridium vincentii]
MNKTFILFGDSLVSGYGVDFKDSWANCLSSFLHIPILNKGINGDTTASMLNRFYIDVSLNIPYELFIMGGTNDLLCGRTVSSIVSNIEEMIKESKCTTYIGIPPFVVKETAEKIFMPSTLYTHCEDSLPLLRTELIKLCTKYSLDYVDFYVLTNNNLDKNIYIDGIHLNELGHALMLKEFLKVVRQ